LVNKVFWADDDKEDVFLFSSTLQELQTKVDCHFLANGKELISFIPTAGQLPQLIVLDLNMPLMNGLETLKHLKSSDKYAHIPVVMFTTSHSTRDMQECRELGAANYYIKPTSYNQLREMISKMLETYGIS